MGRRAGDMQMAFSYFNFVAGRRGVFDAEQAVQEADANEDGGLDLNEVRCARCVSLVLRVCSAALGVVWCDARLLWCDAGCVAVADARGQSAHSHLGRPGGPRPSHAAGRGWPEVSVGAAQRPRADAREHMAASARSK
eukprot:386362-Rhodomonas_salina.1